MHGRPITVNESARCQQNCHAILQDLQRQATSTSFVAVLVFFCIVVGRNGWTAAEGDNRPLAFPTAEGYGRLARGGRGGRVIHVTNLDDGGPGSLRAAVEAEGPRTVVFGVSGMITLESRLVVKNPFLTLAGQTAPGKGVCLRKYNFGMYGTHDVIMRYLRVRPGNMSGQTLDGMPDEWERAGGLDPTDPGDGNRDRNQDGYTNLEEYLGSLVGEFSGGD
jgi:hypothetical protein